MDEILKKLDERLKPDYKGWQEETIELIPGVPFRLNAKQTMAYFPFPDENDFVEFPLEKLLTDEPSPTWLERSFRLADIQAVMNLLPVTNVYVLKNEIGKPLIFKIGEKAFMASAKTDGGRQWEKSISWLYNDEELAVLNTDFNEFPLVLANYDSDIEVIEPGTLLFIRGIDGKPEKLLADFHKYPAYRQYDSDIDEIDGELKRELKITSKMPIEKIIDIFGHMVVKCLHYDVPLEVPRGSDVSEKRTIKIVAGFEIIETVRKITSYQKKGPDLKGKTLFEVHELLSKDFGISWLTTSNFTRLVLLEEPYSLEIDFDEKQRAVISAVRDTRFYDSEGIDPIRSSIPVSNWFTVIMEKIRDTTTAYSIKICKDINEIEVETESYVSSSCEV